MTDEDLENLCQKKVIDAKSLENRREIKNEILAKKALVSTKDMIDHLARIKFTGREYTIFEREEFT